MAGAASAHQAATASREETSQQRAGRTRRTSADPQRAQQGATAAAAAAPAALHTLSRLQRLADASPQVAQLRRLQALADGRFAPVAQLAGDPEEEELVQGKFATAPLQPQLQQAPRANNTGLPDRLKSGIESLSGLSMDHVRVHYNSAQPAQLNALAYAQGSDIHLAPGQERYLPHEAWHVVQQAQGRVRPTLQMAGGVAVNDDAGLEREADVMGGRALAPVAQLAGGTAGEECLQLRPLRTAALAADNDSDLHRAVAGDWGAAKHTEVNIHAVPKYILEHTINRVPLPKVQSSRPVQRKVAYKGSKVANPGDFTAPGTWSKLAKELTDRVQKYMGSLDKQTLRANQELQGAAGLVLADNAGVGMLNAVYRLRAGDKDYGTFDLNDEQHMMLLIFELARSLGFNGLQNRVGKGAGSNNKKKYQDKVKKENKEEIQDHAIGHAEREKERKAHFANSPKPGLTFRLAVLGNGAAASYWLEANRSSVDPIQSVVIGEANPWAGQRGTQGVNKEQMHVNHPMHMISPERSKSGTDDESLALRSKFAEVVKEEISKIVRFVWDTKVNSVRKIESKGASFYKIDTALLGTCYAQHVVAALGTGPHIEAKNKDDINKKMGEMKGGEMKGVKGVPRVMNLDEFQQNASKIRPVDKEVEVEVDIFISGGNAAIDAVTRIVRENEKGRAKFKLIWVTGTRGAQFLTGTDNEEAKAKFRRYLKDPMAAIRGRAGNLSISGNRVAVEVSRLNEEETEKDQKSNRNATMKFMPPEKIEADYYVHGVGQDVGPLLDLFIDKKNDQEARMEFVRGLCPTMDPNFNFGVENKHQAISGYEQRIEGSKDDKYKYYDTGSSLSFVGATASKIAGMLGQSKKHDANIDSLPQNMVGNEQLAPIRSGLESQSGMVPSYVGKEVNYAVDNKTVVRLHIALKYPKIPPKDADMWAEIIVGERRPSPELQKKHSALVGPIPNPVPEQGRVRETAGTFTKAIESILQEANDAS